MTSEGLSSGMIPVPMVDLRTRVKGLEQKEQSLRAFLQGRSKEVAALQVQVARLEAACVVTAGTVLLCCCPRAILLLGMLCGGLYAACTWEREGYEER